MVTRLRQRALDEFYKCQLKLLGADIHKSCRLSGRPIVSLFNGSSIQIGARSAIVSRSSATALGVSHAVVLRTLAVNATIVIGEDCGISGAAICSAARVTIGSGTLIGADVLITDTNFHPPMSLARRYAALPDPVPGDRVSIGSNVFLGARSIVLPGSSIGDNAVVSAGSVVRGVVAANSIYSSHHGKMVNMLDLRQEG